jgi:hypothetical protein
VADEQSDAGQREISDEERRLNRLLFWTIIIMDHALCFGVGRQTSIRIEDITQPLPSQADFQIDELAADSPASAFPHVAKQMLLYGHVVNELNCAYPQAWAREAAQTARTDILKAYSELPEDLQWNIAK